MDSGEIRLVLVVVGGMAGVLAQVGLGLFTYAWVTRKFDTLHDSLTRLTAENTSLRHSLGEDAGEVDYLRRQNQDLHDRLLVINNPGYLRELRKPRAATPGELAQAEVAVLAARRKDPTTPLTPIDPATHEVEVEERRLGLDPGYDPDPSIGVRRQRVDPMQRVEAARAALRRETEEEAEENAAARAEYGVTAPVAKSPMAAQGSPS